MSVKSVPASSAADAATSSPTFANSWKADLVSGFLVSLIALPLCLGIAKASGFPTITGVFTAIAGGLLSVLFSNSELTIKGPAAGMIAIVSGAILDPGWLGRKPEQIAELGYYDTYRFVLAVGVAAGVIQILLGLLKAGVLTEFFPMAPVHGLLASIGFLIISKQSHVMLGNPPPPGVDSSEAPWHAYYRLFVDMPWRIITGQEHQPNYRIMLIGVLSLVILFAFPAIKRRLKFLAALPAQLIVLLVAIPFGYAFDLAGTMRVDLPDSPLQAIVTPDFSQVASTTSMKWIAMFFLVGSLESLLSAKAIDILDPWKRKTNMDRDLLGVGVANTAVAAIGGLPMISEILRSSANISNGGRTRIANALHGVFLLLAVVFLVAAIERIPNAALGAMLVFAGFRLASPKEFVHMWHLGKEQFFVFVLTVACIVPTGNLLLVSVGIVAELLINYFNGASFGTLFKPDLLVHTAADASRIEVAGALTFANWIPFKRRLEAVPGEGDVVVDLGEAQLVDHTAMDKLMQSQREFSNAGRKLSFDGLDGLRSFGHEKSSGRKR